METPDPWEALHQADQEIVEVMRRALGAYQAISIVPDVPLGSILNRLTADMEAKTDNNGRVVVRSRSSAAPPVHPASTSGPLPTHVQHELHQHDEQMTVVPPEAPLQPQPQIVPYGPEWLQSHQPPNNTVTTNTPVGVMSAEDEDEQSGIPACWIPPSSEVHSEETSGIPVSTTPAQSPLRRRPKKRFARRQSGEPGITWNSRDKVWQVYHKASGRKACRYFNPKHYRTAQMAMSFAEQAALDAAIVFKRAADKPDELSKKRECAGIRWMKDRCCWTSYIHVKRKYVHGGCFHPADESPEEMEKARLLAFESHRALRQQYDREKRHGTAALVANVITS